MSVMRKIVLAAACSAALFLASHANAACPNPFTGKDATPTTQNIATQNDANNNCVFESAAYQAVQFSAALQSSAVANGNGTVLSTTGLAGATITVNCVSCSGGTTVNFEAQEDGTDFVPIMGTKLDGSGQATTVTTAGATVWQFNLSGVQQIRARISNYSAGTVGATIHAISVPSSYQTVGALQTTNPWVTGINQFGGSNVATGTGASGSGIPRVTVSNDSTHPVTQSTGSGTNTSAWLTEGGCAGQSIANTKFQPFSIASTTAQLLVALVSAKQVYICAMDLYTTGGAANVALIEGTQGTNPCDTSTAGMAGGTTAATGMGFGPQAGFTKGNGQGVVFRTATAAHQVCLLSSVATQISGSITYAQF
jgi:hypothetical protein